MLLCPAHWNGWAIYRRVSRPWSPAGPSHLLRYPFTIPTNNTPFPNGIIPTPRLSSAALGLLSYYPQQTFPGLASQNYAIAESKPSMSNSVSVRIQGPITNKDRISFNEQFQARHSNSEQLFGYDSKSSATARAPRRNGPTSSSRASITAPAGVQPEPHQESAILRKHERHRGHPGNRAPTPVRSD